MKVSNGVWPSVAVLAAAVVGFVYIAVVQDKPTTLVDGPQIVVVNTAPCPTNNDQPIPTPTSTDSTALAQQALDFLQSPSRAEQFNCMVPVAGIKVAEALMQGRFGPVNKYDWHKKTLKPGNIKPGWGGIETTDNKHAEFAWVYWNTDGTIDYTKPITDVSIQNANGNSATHVEVSGPDAGAPYWHVVKAVSNNTEVTTDTVCINDGNFCQPTKENGGSYSPNSIAGLQELDIDGLNRLYANMASVFGPDWLTSN